MTCAMLTSHVAKCCCTRPYWPSVTAPPSPDSEIRPGADPLICTITGTPLVAWSSNSCERRVGEEAACSDQVTGVPFAASGCIWSRAPSCESEFRDVSAAPATQRSSRSRDPFFDASTALSTPVLRPGKGAQVLGMLRA